MRDPPAETLRLRGIPPFVDATLPLGRRITAITGDNGVGKTVILDALSFMLTGHWPGGRMVVPGVMGTEPYLEFNFPSQRNSEQIKASFMRQRWRWQFGPATRRDPELVVSISARGDLSIFDPLRISQSRSRDHVEPLAFSFSESELWRGSYVFDSTNPEIAQNRKVVCRGLIEDLSTWKFRTKDLFSAFSNMLAALSPPNEILEIIDFDRVDPEDVLYIPLLQTEYGTIPVTHASAGVRKILGLCYGIIWAIDQNASSARLNGTGKSTKLVILIDEIEGHFHPRWQRVIVRALLIAVQTAWGHQDVRLVFTTHSPMVMAGAEDIADPDLDTQVLVDLGGVPPEAVIRAAPWTKHGTVTDWLGSPQFGDVVPSSDAYANAHAALAALIAQGHASDEEIANLQTQLQAALPDDDPAWQEWSWFLEDRKLQAKAL